MFRVITIFEPGVWKHWFEDFSQELGERVESIAKDIIEMLQRYAWPGTLQPHGDR